jgi:hypothetical protein
MKLARTIVPIASFSARWLGARASYVWNLERGTLSASQSHAASVASLTASFMKHPILVSARPAAATNFFVLIARLRRNVQCNTLKKLARPKGFEPLTPRFVDGRFLHKILLQLN